MVTIQIDETKQEGRKLLREIVKHNRVVYVQNNCINHTKTYTCKEAFTPLLEKLSEHYGEDFTYLLEKLPE